MKAALIGTKVGMTRVIGEGGAVTTVTVIKAGPCVVTQVKSCDSDGYDAVQLGFENAKPHRSTMALIGHAAKAKTGPKRFSREFRLQEPADVNLGEVLTVSQFAEDVSFVDVVGTTKGKGFAGTMKRHGYGGLTASHGVERKHRSPGSIGGASNLGTGRGVKKGKKMSGHMGCVRRTAEALKLVDIDTTNDLLIVAGSVPGPNGGSVIIQQSKKRG